jgi:hypothetical protein
MKALLNIQQKLKAPKGQYNTFGKYAYRNQEDILEAVKPLLAEEGVILTLSDSIVEISGVLFMKATAELSSDEETVTVEAYAMHAKEQKGMNEAQITGAASSYARKYALNGLFLIDDTKDADATEKHEDKAKKAPKPASKAETPKPAAPKADKPKEPEFLVPGTSNWDHSVKRIKETRGTDSPVTVETILKFFRLSEENLAKLKDETKA